MYSMFFSQRAKWFQFVLVLNLGNQLHSISYDDDYHDIFHSKDLVVGDSRRRILASHNSFRSRVQPPASNMLKMRWDLEAGYNAQRFADKCNFMESNDFTNSEENTNTNLGTCGQNVYFSRLNVLWNKVIEEWFSENKVFKYGDPAMDLSTVANYTQLVWATSHKVGCGLAYCTGGPWGYFYKYVCQYCPGGNIPEILHYPYKKGAPCSDCPGNCENYLCNNTCPYVDILHHCEARVSYNDHYCDMDLCNATCHCGSTLYKDYPWF